MTRRTQRSRTIYDSHRDHLMRLAYGLWKDCVPPMVVLRPESSDYAAVVALQAATVTFSKTISGGVSWVSSSSATPMLYVPTELTNPDEAVDSMISECSGDPRLAVRVLLDTVAQLELDHERLLAQM